MACVPTDPENHVFSRTGLGLSGLMSPYLLMIRTRSYTSLSRAMDPRWNCQDELAQQFWTDVKEKQPWSTAFELMSVIQIYEDCLPAYVSAVKKNSTR